MHIIGRCEVMKAVILGSGNTQKSSTMKISNNSIGNSSGSVAASASAQQITEKMLDASISSPIAPLANPVTLSTTSVQREAHGAGFLWRRALVTPHHFFFVVIKFCLSFVVTFLSFVRRQF